MAFASLFSPIQEVKMLLYKIYKSIYLYRLYYGLVCAEYSSTLNAKMSPSKFQLKL
jgi:hypothetical protein